MGIWASVKCFWMTSREAVVPARRAVTTAGVGEVHRGSENKAVCFPGLLEPVVDHILIKDAPAGFLAVAAAGAVPHRLPPQLENFRFDPI